MVSNPTLVFSRLYRGYNPLNKLVTEFVPNGIQHLDTVSIDREEQKGMGLKIGAQFAPAELGVNFDGNMKASYKGRAYATCDGSILREDRESLLRWILKEHSLESTGITWHPTLPKPQITIRIPRERLSRVTLGYQITCEFEPDTFFRRMLRRHKHGQPGTSPNDFRVVSFDLTAGGLDAHGNAQDRDNGEWVDQILSGLGVNINFREDIVWFERNENR
jgi:hypothetical protein